MMSDALVKTIDGLTASLSDLFARIAERTGDENGISRGSYGEAETAAAEILMDYARRQGLDVGYDRVGNVTVTAQGQFETDPEILIGSHIDSVPRGGNYDGLAGVIAGIGTLVALEACGLGTQRGVRVIGFRGEESPWFGTAYLGSKLFTGQLTLAEAEAMHRFDTGRTLAQHLTEIGVERSQIDGRPAVSLDRVRAYLELHIEQGPELVDLGRPIAIATAIRGNIRYPFAKCIGRYAHSAAVPRRLRADAMMATAKLIAFADEQWRREIEAGHEDLVFTCGICQTNSAEHSMTKVPGETNFTLNIGSISDAVMDRVHQSLLDKAQALAEEHHVRFELGERVGTGAVALDPEVIGEIAGSCQSIETDPHTMATVGHDAAIFARMGIPAGIILIRNDKGSHNREEQMDMDDFSVGLKVLASSVNGIVTRAEKTGG
jgi:beta-ureidopropionase / N-carbamoyl-L-amino-acid hydrolase